MPKLPAVKPRQVIRFLEQNGFILDHTSGSHFIFYDPASRRRAVVPNHNRDLPKGTRCLCYGKRDSPAKSYSTLWRDDEFFALWRSGFP
jgi:predicted RNA binding protein YcfA (HicA-like mRNA interferase family)